MVVSYNVQALFDGVDDGDEFEGFSLSGKWSLQRYRDRLARTATALVQSSPAFPSIIILQEVEHEKVVEDLIEFDLGRRGLLHYAVTASSSSPIEVALISAYPIVSSRIHRVGGFRDILESVVNVDGEDIRIFVLHLRSRREGDRESEGERIEQIRALRRIIEEQRRSGILLPTIIAGDFNESADQHERIRGAYQSALIPWDASRRREWEAAGSLVITPFIPEEGEWYSHSLDERFPVPSESPGSYYYDGLWESYDQILLSSEFFDTEGLRFHSGGVISHPSLLTEKATPLSYRISTHRGVSDHLPVYTLFENGN